MLNDDQQIRFTQLWTEAQPTVSQYVASLIRDQGAVRDIVQNTSLALLRKYSDYDDSRPFLAWALGVAKFEILGHRRDFDRNRMIFDSEFIDLYTQGWVDAAPRINDESMALQDCVRELKERAQEIVRLRYAEDQTSESIAGRLNLTAANVRAILKRSRDVLRRCVEKRGRLRGGSV